MTSEGPSDICSPGTSPFGGYFLSTAYEPDTILYGETQRNKGEAESLWGSESSGRPAPPRAHLHGRASAGTGGGTFGRHSGGASGSPRTQRWLPRQGVYELSHEAKKEKIIKKHGQCDHTRAKTAREQTGTKQQA